MATIDSSRGYPSVSELQVQLEKAKKGGSSKEKDEVLTTMTNLFKEQLKKLEGTFKEDRFDKTLRPEELKDMRSLYKALEADKKDFDVLLNKLGDNKEGVIQLLKRTTDEGEMERVDSERKLERALDELIESIPSDPDAPRTDDFNKKIAALFPNDKPPHLNNNDLDNKMKKIFDRIKEKREGKLQRYATQGDSFAFALIQHLLKSYPLYYPSGGVMLKAMVYGNRSFFEALQEHKKDIDFISNR